ncbi:MAG: FAD-binding oxidoreductase [Pseudomonadota bacterium]
MQDRIAVIGGGIVGVSTALHLQRRGQKVVLIDPVEPGDPAQTSFGNAGILAREGVSPVATPAVLFDIPKILTGRGPIYVNWKELPGNLRWIAQLILSGRHKNRAAFSAAMNGLVYDTVEQHLALAKGTSAERYIRQGLFTFLYQDETHRASDALSRKFQKDNGVLFDLASRETLASRDPHLSARYQAGVDFEGHGWITNPSAYVNALFQHFLDIGGSFENAKVAAISENNLVLEDGRNLTASQHVISAGAWSAEILKSLNVKMPLRAERGYHLRFQNPSMKPPHPYLIMDNRFGFTPMDTELRAAGTTDLSSSDAPPKKLAHKNLRRFVHMIYPELKFDDVQEWTGSRPTLSDGLPAIGRLEKAPRIICAFGSQHMGLTMGPKLGAMVADMVDGQHTNVDLTPYSPDRFAR